MLTEACLESRGGLSYQRHPMMTLPELSTLILCEVQEGAERGKAGGMLSKAGIQQYLVVWEEDACRCRTVLENAQVLPQEA